MLARPEVTLWSAQAPVHFEREYTAKRMAELLIESGGVKFDFEKGYTFKSGIKSPMYVNCRQLFFEPERSAEVCELMKASLDPNSFDVVAGVESGANSPARDLAMSMQKNHVFIRKEAKGHGTKDRIEQGDINGKRVLVVEDMFTTGGSSASATQAVTDAGGTPVRCLSLATYNFDSSRKAFEALGVPSTSLTNASAIIEAALEKRLVTPQQAELLRTWLVAANEEINQKEKIT